jgi:DNA-binding Xre family transcriptional regulator
MSDTSLSMHAIDMIKSWIGRRDLNKSELARRLDVSHTWVSNRLAGNQELTLNELERIAAALDVDVAELLPTRTLNKTSSPPPVRPSGPRSQRALLAPGHTGGRHPTGRPASATSGATPAELRRPAISGHTHSGSST